MPVVVVVQHKQGEHQMWEVVVVLLQVLVVQV
jgi:hypothetical protein